MANTHKNKGAKNIGQQNVLETLRDIGTQAAISLKDEVFGNTDKKALSGDIRPGESVSMKDIFSQKSPETAKLQNHFVFERHLFNEEKAELEKKTNELRLQLHAIIQEVKALAQVTQNMSQELKVATMQTPVEPGIYHVIFFEKLLETIKSFRKKIENASVWLGAINKRGQKKNYWAMYKESKGSFLLSPEHYVQRNAG